MQVFAFKGGQAGVEQFAPRDHDNVEPGCDLIATENLSNQTFRSISRDRPTEFPRGGDPQPAQRTVVRQEEEREISTVDLGAAAIDPLKVGAGANPLAPAESSHAQRQARIFIR